MTPSDLHPNQHTNSQKFLGLLLMIVAWSGVLLQFWISLNLADPSGKSIVTGLVKYFGFFTVTTNIFVALALTLPAFASGSRLGRFFARPQILACAATSIGLVGLGYHFLLRDLWNPVGSQWLADQILHYLTPLTFCIYWLFTRQKTPLPWWSPLVWSWYPLLYFIYSLVRGAVLGIYPYPFIDVTSIGYSIVLRNAFGLWFAFILVGWSFLILTNMIIRSKKFYLGNASL